MIDRGLFEVVCKEAVPEGANVMGGRFVLSTKNPGRKEELYKAPFIVKGHTDIEKHLLVHNSTTLKHHSIRILVELASIFGFEVWLQDVSQACFQSANRLM